MGYVDRIGREHAGSGDVVGVRVAVNHVSHRLVGNLGDRLQVFISDRRRGVHGDDSLPGGQEHNLVRAFGNPVKSVAQVLNQISLVLRNSRTHRRSWDGSRVRNVDPCGGHRHRTFHPQHPMNGAHIFIGPGLAESHGKCLATGQSHGVDAHDSRTRCRRTPQRAKVNTSGTFALEICAIKSGGSLPG